MTPATQLTPARRIDGATAYRVDRPPTPMDLYLDGNEGAVPPKSLVDALRALAPDVLRCYPHRETLEAVLAARLGVAPEQVIVTAGGDDSLDRICRAMLEPGRELILPEPSFEMINRYARLAGGDIVSVPWPDGPYPTQAVLDAVSDRTAMIAVVSPNNPTGCVATADDLRRLSAAAPSALLLVDLAYIEFADEDLAPVALSLPNAVIVRTVSKAWGLAGLRIGYAAGPTQIVNWLRAAGGPYAASGPSIAMATQRVETGDDDMNAFVAEIRRERAALTKLLTDLGATPIESQANFILCRFRNALWVRDGLAGMGIAVRHFGGRPELADALRITLPGDKRQFERLASALRNILRPQTLLFDMDGVLADTSAAMTACMLATIRSFGVETSVDEMQAVQRESGVNNPIAVARLVLQAHGVGTDPEEAARKAEEVYYGDSSQPGCRTQEQALVSKEWLAALRKTYRLGVVTGRTRDDAVAFLERTGLAPCFDVVVAADDAPPKPDPEPIRRALEQLETETAWMIGDSTADMLAARAAGVTPVGVVPPNADPAAVAETLMRAGAGRVLLSLDELEQLLP